MLKQSSMALLVAAALVLTGCPKGGTEKAASTEGGQTEAHEGEASHTEGAGEHHDEKPGAHGTEEKEGAHADEHGHEEGGPVKMTEEGQRKSGIKTAPAAVRTLPSGITTTGTFEANADREAHVTPRIQGRIVKVLATVGTRVRAGQSLATLESVELGRAQREFLKAQARRDLAASTAQRQNTLFAKDLTARKDVQAAENELRQADIELESARNELKLLGYDASRTARLVATRQLDPTVPILAPIGGTVIARHVTLGEMVSAEATEPIYTVLDNADLWVNANLYERDLLRVAEGQSATVTTTAFPGKTFRGRVTYISSALDPATRTAKARITVSNPDRILKPAMFARVTLQTGTQQALAVPDSAVQQDQETNESFVFVKEGADAFEKRIVKLGPKTGGYFPVVSGVQAGDQIVVDGAFTLKSELLKESFGEHEH